MKMAINRYNKKVYKVCMYDDFLKRELDKNDIKYDVEKNKDLIIYLTEMEGIFAAINARKIKDYFLYTYIYTPIKDMNVEKDIILKTLMNKANNKRITIRKEKNKVSIIVEVLETKYSPQKVVEEFKNNLFLLKLMSL